KNTAQNRPLILVLDDLHWADTSSLLLLQFLARRMGDSRILVIGTYRDVELSRQHPLSETLAQLSREPVFLRFLLQGLSREDTGDFIGANAGISPSQGLIDAIYSRTEGNPFFTTEVIRLLRGQGRLAAEADDEFPSIQLPQGVREVIGQRLVGLTEDCHQLLVTAAVIGREFDFRLLRELQGGVAEEELLALLEEGLEARLIEEVPGSAERYQFSHALIQETLANELSSARRVRRHARIGAVLEGMYGASAESHAPELAYHFAQAEPVLGPEKLVRYSLLAGEQALATYAHEEALSHFQRALAVEDGHITDTETGTLWFGLGRAQLSTLPKHQIGEGLISLSHASYYYVRAGDVAGAVAVAEYPLPVVVGQLAGAAQLIERALELVPSDSHQAGRLFSRYIGVVGTELGDYERAQEAFYRALAIAQRDGDAGLELRALVSGANADAYHLRWEQGLEKNLRAIELARQVDDPLAQVEAHFSASAALWRLGEPARAQLQASAMRTLAERMGYRHYLSRAHTANANRLVWEGKWQEARDSLDRALTVAAQDTGPLATRVLLEALVGDPEQTNHFLERLLEALNLIPSGATYSYARASMLIPLISRMALTTDYCHLAMEWAEAILAAENPAPSITVFA
ncbi:MAG: hypothetical protein ACE5Q6_25990, partial [Dehalococcoidia bacterium]